MLYRVTFHLPGVSVRTVENEYSHIMSFHVMSSIRSFHLYLTFGFVGSILF